MGGCVMGNDASDGVMDKNGTAFNTEAGGQSVHRGPYVADAAVGPGLVAVNPTLAIVTLVRKIAA